MSFVHGKQTYYYRTNTPKNATRHVPIPVQIVSKLGQSLVSQMLRDVDKRSLNINTHSLSRGHAIILMFCFFGK